MSDPDELALVEKAVSLGAQITGCCEWDDEQATRVRGDRSLKGLTPEHIRQRLFEFVAEGGKIKQVKERRPEYADREYYYKAIVEEPGFKHCLFVEIDLIDDDPDLPAVAIVNAHPQRK